MTRIRTIPRAHADESLRAARDAQHGLYPPEYATPVFEFDDDAAGIVAAHSLIPDALHHAFATFGLLMSPDLPLERRQHEMIATVVSVANRTHYCTGSHTEFLQHATLDDELAEAIRRDFRSAAIFVTPPTEIFLGHTCTPGARTRVSACVREWFARDPLVIGMTFPGTVP